MGNKFLKRQEPDSLWTNHSSIWNGQASQWVINQPMMDAIDYVFSHQPFFRDSYFWSATVPCSDKFPLQIMSINFAPPNFDIIPVDMEYMLKFAEHKVLKGKCQLTVHIRPNGAMDKSMIMELSSFHPLDELNGYADGYIPYHNKFLEIIENCVNTSVEEVTGGAFKYL
jgi:hypothetical protein